MLQVRYEGVMDTNQFQEWLNYPRVFKRMYDGLTLFLYMDRCGAHKETLKAAEELKQGC